MPLKRLSPDMTKKIKKLSSYFNFLYFCKLIK